MKKLIASSLFLLALPLVAWADRPAGHPHHAPPPEAFAACERRAAGDACTVTFGDHTITGTCAAPPDAQQLACRPDHPPAR
ncbi:MAG TPA: hypothetical protein VFP84_33195 [Kofleriaceae bacterium]|nr:hypothetical protein [Kofleriaceae bacterium]